MTHASPSPEDRTVERRLDALARRVFGSPATNAARMTGGASQEIWSFDVGDRGYVLRRSPAADLGSRMATAGLETEAAVIEAVRVAGVPVPMIAYVLSPDDLLGQGFIATRMPGEALGRRVVDHSDFATIRPFLAHECGTILGAIHDTPINMLPSLAMHTPADSVDALDRLLRSFDGARPVFEVALIWLKQNCPAPTPPRLVHGDFRTGNFLLEPAGISAILDWEACHFGDPMEDLGWLCMPVWRFSHLDRPVGGFGQREDLYAAYTRATGRQVDPIRVRFWEIHGMLRWGLTCMLMADDFRQNGGSIERAAVGRRASEAEIELLHAIAPRNV
jgi:aminoglycoside phosphotransferase (APT) family kinase protein